MFQRVLPSEGRWWGMGDVSGVGEVEGSGPGLAAATPDQAE